MDLKTDLILVTGAPGWIGTRLVNSLVHGLSGHEALCKPQQGLRIRCLVLPGQDFSELTSLSDRIEIIIGDIRSPSSCEAFVKNARGGLLFHAAGIIHPRRISELYEVNVQGTNNLLYAALHEKVKRAVVVSSNSPFGFNPCSNHLFDESSPYNPYMNYGRSKKEMEEIVKNIQALGVLETVIIRPPWFYGPNQPFRQSLFFKMIKEGKGPVIGDGRNRRSMVYVDNLCQGLLLAALEEEANGGVYWVADERPYFMNEIIDTIERLLEEEFDMEVAHKRLKLPGMVCEFARVCDMLIQKAGFYNQQIHVLSEMNKTIACSVEKAKNELGYHPMISLEEGMRRSIQWCLDNGIKI